MGIVFIQNEQEVGTDSSMKPAFVPNCLNIGLHSNSSYRKSKN